MNKTKKKEKRNSKKILITVHEISSYFYKPNSTKVGTLYKL